ncbi:hypothetical protein HG535_0G02720 [Zygotorulaspora mrakii]|uniref:Lysophospholipase n=1 Tax=Zygotorulaspora mrakii TaxID=42260 RepID=A0A7H9B8R9_ZYGMR|nr:uncharacterized protein HG535_0G02720 [Zygotorulaspora mrakii]QLG74389.1 hypothetical protein HG535_0G02720 [Zygotorulaspora mrakii]
MNQLSLTFIVLLQILVKSSIAWSPTNGYVPGNVTCDDDINLIREANELSPNETDWLRRRSSYTNEALQNFLTRATRNFSDDSIVSQLFRNNSNVPKIGIACSGGGYRAMLSGAGMIAAMDNRTDGALDHGLGGLLQSATYLAGLSGGNWLTTTLAWNNWTSVQTILNNMTEDDSIWDISNSIINPGGINIVSSGQRWNHISDAVQAKQDAGFNISLTDVWGRALSYNFFPTLYRGGVGYTWSTLREADEFRNAEMPFPISVADGRYPGSTIIDLNATVFEFNPFEMGSWDPTINSFTDVRYLGTNVSNGTPTNQGQCIAGFDNVGFIAGTSSSLFNQFILQINGTALPSFLRNIANRFLQNLASEDDDIAIYAPNPFKDSEFVESNFSRSIVESDYLYLVDGGEDDQNVPLLPLIQQQRDLDVVFALDNSADTSQSWPDGSSLVHTYQRQFGAQGKDMAFPYVPDENTFINLGLNQRPAFFGCDARNLSDLNYVPPLIVYIPNSRHSFNGNQSTFKLSYDTDERFGMIQNGFEAATMGNLTQDSNFLGCVACAVLRRKQQSLNATLPSECNDCFRTYCWNGTVDSSTPDDQNSGDTSSRSQSASSTSAGSSSKHNGGELSVQPRTFLSILTLLTTIAGLM